MARALGAQAAAGKQRSMAVVVVIAGLICAQGPASAQSTQSAAAAKIFTVGNYPVEGRGADPVAAKARAMADGERNAFKSLLKRLVPVTAYGRLKKLATIKTSALLEGTAMRSERNSATEYIANLDFAFSPQAVRALLEREGIPFADAQAAQVVVVPVWQSPAAASGATPVPQNIGAGGLATWTAAWKSLDLQHTLAPVKLETLPQGVSIETVKGVIANTSGAYANLAGALKAERLVVALAEPDLATRKLTVTIAGLDATGPITWSKVYRLDADPSYTVELAAVVSLGVLEGRWKSVSAKGGRNVAVAGGWQGGAASASAASSVSAPEPPNTSTPVPGNAKLTLQVEFRGMGEWTDLSRKLAATAGIEELDVAGMNQRGARVTLRYPGGSMLDLQRALSQQGLILRNASGQWIVTAAP